MQADLSDESSAESILLEYFPEALRKKYSNEIRGHRLKSEIINTIVTNEFVNRLGPTFVFRMQQELNVSVRDIAAAFLIARSTFRMPELWASIESLDNIVSSDEQYRMQILVRGLIERATHWLLRSRQPSTGIEELVLRFQSGIDELIASMPECLADVQRKTLEQRINHFKQAGTGQGNSIRLFRHWPTPGTDLAARPNWWAQGQFTLAYAGNGRAQIRFTLSTTASMRRNRKLNRTKSTWC